MVSLVCGLNTYLGRAGVTYLQDDNFTVVGVVRDLSLLRQNLYGAMNAEIHEFDLFRNNKSFEKLNLPKIDLAFYFAQIPDISDSMGLTYELISLNNYINLLKYNNIKRLIYVGKVYEKKYIPKIKELLVSSGLMYTIVLKDVAVGMATHFDKFMQALSLHKYIFIYKPQKRMYFTPIVLKDLFRWIREVDWINSYHNSIIEFGGDQVFEVDDVIVAYLKKQSTYKSYKIIPLSSKMLTAGLNSVLYKIDYNIYLDYIKEMYSRVGVDNSTWNTDFSFEYSSVYDAL